MHASIWHRTLNLSPHFSDVYNGDRIISFYSFAGQMQLAEYILSRNSFSNVATFTNTVASRCSKLILPKASLLHGIFILRIISQRTNGAYNQWHLYEERDKSANSVRRRHERRERQGKKSSDEETVEEDAASDGLTEKTTWKASRSL